MRWCPRRTCKSSLPTVRSLNRSETSLGLYVPVHFQMLTASPPVEDPVQWDEPTVLFIEDNGAHAPSCFHFLELLASPKAGHLAACRWHHRCPAPVLRWWCIRSVRPWGFLSNAWLQLPQRGLIQVTAVMPPTEKFLEIDVQDGQHGLPMLLEKFLVGVMDGRCRLNVLAN